MALLSGFPVSISEVRLMGDASRAAFAGAVPAGWSVVLPTSLGLAASYQSGNHFVGNGNGASAIVLQKGNEYIVAFRGTDGADDIARYPELFAGTYINHFQPLLNALANQAPGGSKFYFTGASLGGGATNLMAKIADTAYGGRYADAKFVAFASPNIVNDNQILNIGFDNDPVFKAINLYKDFASSLDNLVLATGKYMAGNTTGRNPFDMYAHSSSLGFDAFNRLENSHYISKMHADSVVIFDAHSGWVQDMDPGRAAVGVFYLGEEVGDHIIGRDGDDLIEGFGGDDILQGGRGNDMIRGGDGNDTLYGGDGNDTLRAEDGDDTIKGQAGNDKLFGGAGNDVVSGGDGNDKVHGDAGNDVLKGGAGNDTLDGGDGNDELHGGKGNDSLTGGSGADTFFFAQTGSANADIIHDYNFTEGDVIDLSKLLDANFGPTSVVADFVRLKNSGSDVLLQVDVDGTVGGKNFSTVATLAGYATPGVDQVLVYFEQQSQILSV